MELKILYDNRAVPGFKAGWGFSALLSTEVGDVLFDTGADVETLNFNAKRLGVEKEHIVACFISHKHFDHTGGLGWFDGRVFFPGEYDGSVEGVHALISDRPIKEQAIIYRNVMLVGCSHPGIVLMARGAFQRYGRLKLIVGGMHLFNTPVQKIREIAEELKDLTEKIAPCHCTGDAARRIFMETFGKNYIDAKAGTIISF